MVSVVNLDTGYTMNHGYYHHQHPAAVAALYNTGYSTHTPHSHSNRYNSFLAVSNNGGTGTGGQGSGGDHSGSSPTAGGGSSAVYPVQYVDASSASTNQAAGATGGAAIHRVGTPNSEQIVYTNGQAAAGTPANTMYVLTPFLAYSPNNYKYKVI